jgi:hypothetical protein
MCAMMYGHARNTGHGELMQLEEGELERRANVAQRIHKLMECRAPKPRITALREYSLLLS